jgi:hypothetical protein
MIEAIAHRDPPNWLSGSILSNPVHPLLADSVAKGAAANFPAKNEKNEKNENRRSIEPQTHYENRL